MQTTRLDESAASELRALLAIAHKEWLIFRRYPGWVVAFLIWPVLYPFGYIFSARALAGPHGSGISTFNHLAGTTDYLSFIVVGSTMYMWLNITLWDVGFHLRNEQMRGTLESNWLCPVWRISIMLGSSITKLATALVFLAVTVGEFWLVFHVAVIRGNLGLVILILLLVSASIYGIGLTFGSLVLRFREANAMVFLVRGLFLVFCGISYPLQVLPSWMKEIAALLPLTYAVHAIRAVSLNGATFTQIRPDLQALLIFALVLPLLGYVSFHHTERRARRTGSLAHYWGLSPAPVPVDVKSALSVALEVEITTMTGLTLARPSWPSHVRALLAIARKDWLHFLRYPLNAAFRVIQPIMWLAPIYFLGKSFATPHGNTGFAAYAGTTDFMSFVLVGAILSNYVSAVFWGMGFALKSEMDEGVLESNWMLPVPRPLFLVGQTVASLGITTLTSAGVLLLAALLFGVHISGAVLPAALVLIPMLVTLYGFGFAFAGLVFLLRDANTLVDVSDFLVSQLSGSQFPVEVLPRFLLPFALALPLTYAYDAVRGYLLHTRTLLPIPDELGILLIAMVLMVLLGYAAFRRIERRCQSLGTIGTH